eukprot:snap_masked-scaffold_3-processed-gene-1.29-mRNA-1 protein AED:1.00 eAED:1.00 QI:0/0/0/0/1/1/2/0/110
MNEGLPQDSNLSKPQEVSTLESTGPFRRRRVPKNTDKKQRGADPHETIYILQELQVEIEGLKRDKNMLKAKLSADSRHVPSGAPAQFSVARTIPSSGFTKRISKTSLVPV